MANDYQSDGDVAFIGLNSRDNPAALPKGIVSQSQNFRMDRGIATVRKGIQRKTASVLRNQTIYGSGVYIDQSGQEIIVIVVTDGLYSYNPQTETISAKINFPTGETITTPIGCEVVSAIDKVYITRGHDKRPMVWDLNTTITAFPTTGVGNAFPNCVSLLYYCNRMIAMGQDHNNGYTAVNHPRVRDTVCVSNYLDFNNWDAADAFTFNQGANDEVTAIAPWTLNEFVVFMRNSIFYVNIGLGRYGYSDPLATDTFIKTLVSDIGCMARKSVVQADGGIIFLSDSGVYFMSPSQVGSNESMRLLTSADPLSAPINDVIQRINRNYASGAVATYWNGRYYLAVPIDGATSNNAVLVYNFILKQWESVDVYPDGFSPLNFVIAKKDNQRRMFAIDDGEGVFLMEQLDWDEFGSATGQPILPFYLPATLNDLAYQRNQINAILRTRSYTFGTYADKRFTNSEVNYQFQAGSHIETYADVSNQDSVEHIDNYGSPIDNDETRRTPVRRYGTSMQLRFIADNLRPSIRSAFIYATVKVKNIISKK